MGTRADFYIGRGEHAEYLGSVAMDGYPSGVLGDEAGRAVLTSTTEEGFLGALKTFLAGRKDGSIAERNGWPWPWKNSGSTDFAYAFDDGQVWASAFGHWWWRQGLSLSRQTKERRSSYSRIGARSRRLRTASGQGCWFLVEDEMSQMPWIKPMRARDLVDDALLDDPAYACEEKCDGIRVKIQLDAGRVVSVMSRNQKPVDGPGLEWLMRLDGNGMNADVEGELYVPGGVSSDVAHHLAANKPLSLALFDVLRLGGLDAWQRSYESRRGLVLHVVGRLASVKIRATKVFPFARQAFETVKASGGEGVMLKRLDASYEPGIESWAWQKVKVTSTIDAVIVDAESKPTQWTVRPGNVGTDGKLYPEGKLSEPWQKGYVGLSYGFFNPIDGKTLRYGSLGVTGPKDEMVKLVGRVVELKAYAVLPSGKLQHVQYLRVRDDKDPAECVAPRATKLAASAMAKG